MGCRHRGQKRGAWVRDRIKRELMSNALQCDAKRYKVVAVMVVQSIVRTEPLL